MKISFSKTNKYVLFVLGIVVSIVILIYIMKKHDIEHFAEEFPKRIWTYWDSSIPTSVQLCLKSWKKYAPEYNVTVLTKSNVKSYVDLPESILNHPNFNDSSARFSDLLRLYLLSKYGGIWMDASILMSVPLNEWLSLDNNEFFGYYSQQHTQGIPPVIESWFLVANPGSSFVKAWYEEFLNMSEFPTVSEYVQSRRDMGVNTSSLDAIHYTDYLAVYVACEKVFQVDKYPLTTLKLWKAEEGPYRYSHELGWDVSKSMPIVCTTLKYRQPIIKFTKAERNELDNRLHSDLSNDKCKWV